MQIIEGERKKQKEREMGGANERRGRTPKLRGTDSLSPVRSSLVHGPSGEFGELATIDAWLREAGGGPRSR